MGIIIVDIKSRVPIYEQIINAIKDAVLSGLMTADEALPSVRSLASELAINPNTIQKAYSELERQGIVYSVPGRGSFVSSNTAEIEQQHRERILSSLKEELSEAIKLGVTIKEIENIYNELKEGKAE